MVHADFYYLLRFQWLEQDPDTTPLHVFYPGRPFSKLIPAKIAFSHHTPRLVYMGFTNSTHSTANALDVVPIVLEVDLVPPRISFHALGHQSFSCRVQVEAIQPARRAPKDQPVESAQRTKISSRYLSIKLCA
jgi:hypothetical protein